VLIHFLYEFPLLIFLTFGLFELSELSYLRGFIEQTSFFSARSQFVGSNPNRVIQYSSKNILEPLTLQRSSEGMSLKHKHQNNIMEVGLSYLPLRHLLKMDSAERFSTFYGTTPLPSRASPKGSP